MKLKHITLLVALFATVTTLFAQKTITGTVIDADSKEPLIGATILVKGTDKGTVADAAGVYS